MNIERIRNVNWRKCTTILPKRFNIAVMLFMMVLVLYMARVNFSLNLLAMATTKKSGPVPDHGPRYNWTSREKTMIIGSYAYGYMATSIPGGMLAERYGGKAVAGYSTFFTAIFTALTPLAASWGSWAVFAVRFAIGFFGGVIYPCCHCLISKWAPPQEMGKFVAVLMGGTFGTVITFPISGMIVEEMGWPWAFYIFAIFIAIITVTWFIIVYDSPDQHTTITIAERHLIQRSRRGFLSKKKRIFPFKHVFMSLPFWSLLILHYGNNWGLAFLTTPTTKFMNEVLQFKLSSTGFWVSLPHLARLLCGFGFGAVVDIIHRNELLSVTQIRKYFCISSHVLPGICLIILAYFGREPSTCITIMTLCLGFNGACTVTNLANSQDLAPNFAGTLYGAINFVGTTPGIFLPIIVAYYTKENNTIDQWQDIFLISAGAYIFPVFIFWAFGTGEIQHWNKIHKLSIWNVLINRNQFENTGPNVVIDRKQTENTDTN